MVGRLTVPQHTATRISSALVPLSRTQRNRDEASHTEGAAERWHDDRYDTIQIDAGRRGLNLYIGNWTGLVNSTLEGVP
jgi:hypothetical protein